MKDFFKEIVRKLPFIRKVYHTIQDYYKLLSPPHKTPLGFFFSGNPLMENGEFEKLETAFIDHVLGDVDVFVNIGANAGYYCCLALQKKVPVVAFEPFPRNVKLLKKNLRSNSFTDIEILPVALGDHSGFIDLYGFGTGASLIEGWAGFSSSYRTTVPCTTLDEALGERLLGKRAFFLVDIEGAEKMMLEGAACNLHSEPRPIWMVEISVFDLQPEGQTINPFLLDTFRLFFDAGYRAYALDNSEITFEKVKVIVDTGKGSLGSNSIVFK